MANTGDLADRVIVALDRAAQEPASEDQRGHLKRAAAFLSDAGRDLLVEVVAAATMRAGGGGLPVVPS